MSKHCALCFGFLWFTSLVQGDDFFSEEIDEDYSFQVVSTSARMSQSVRNSSQSVTILTADMLERAGVYRIVDVLRLVPGYYVDKSHIARLVRSEPTSFSMQRVGWLVDGKSVKNSDIFTTMPLVFSEIDRVEVVHGNAAQQYGSGAFFGVVNFITKTPEGSLGDGTTVNLYASDDEDSGAYISHSNSLSDNTFFTVTLDTLRLDGGEYYQDARMLERTKREDSEEKVYFKWRSTTTVGETGAIRINHQRMKANARWQTEYSPFPLVDGEHLLQDITSELTQIFYNNTFGINEFEISLGVRDTDSDFDFNVCLPRVLLGEPSLENVCGNLRAMEYEQSIPALSIDNITSFSQKLRVSSVIQLAKFEGNSPGIDFDDEINLPSSDAFINAEYLLSKRYTINIGFQGQSNDYRFERPEFTPKLGVNIHWDSNNWYNTVRLNYTNGKQETFGQTSRNVTIFLDTADGRLPGLLAAGAGDYDPEHREEVVSQSVSWYTKFRDSWESDINLFYDKFDELLRINTTQIVGQSRFSLESERRQGVGFTLTYTSDIMVRLAGHYQDFKKEIDSDNYRWYGGSILLSKDFIQNWTVTGAYYGQSETPHFAGQDFVDLTVLYKPEAKNFSVSGTVRKQREHNVDAYQFFSGVERGQFEDDIEFRLRLKVKIK